VVLVMVAGGGNSTVSVPAVASNFAAVVSTVARPSARG
jgi:hypothetical protein